MAAGGTGIRAQIAADSILQDEINRGLALLAFPVSGGRDHRLVRVLARVIEASWSEHVSFQEQVIFPVIARVDRSTLGILKAVERLRAEHAGLGRRHAKLATLLAEEFARRPESSQPPASAHAEVREVLDLRRRHFDAEDAIADRIPPDIAELGQTLYETWVASRHGLPFPVGLFARRQLSGRRSGQQR